MPQMPRDTAARLGNETVAILRAGRYVSSRGVHVDISMQLENAATNALSHEADIAKVQEWLGHANVSTTRLYDRRMSKTEDSSTFHVKY